MSVNYPDQFKDSATQVERAIGLLMEHFDCVQVLCSRVTPDRETESYYQGAGNWHGRQGMAREFLSQDQAQTNAAEIAKVMPQEPPDDSDQWKRP
jgi:hypothetical protein